MIKDTLETGNHFSIPKRKGHFMVLICSLKKNILTLLFCLLCAGLILFSNANFRAAENGLYLWATSVIPALFPFFVATELLSNTCIIPFLGKYLSPIMRPLFGVPGEAAFAFLMGLISGYPVGAKIVSNFYENGICSKEEAERMLSFTNNSGPLFIIGTVGVSLFGNSTLGILLFITHILACISVGITLNLFGFSKHSASHFKSNIPTTKQEQTVTFSSLGEVLGKSITNSISTILLIGGFVVMFSVIISILTQSHLLEIASSSLEPIFSALHIPISLTQPILCGMVELTNGVNAVANVSLKEISVSVTVCAFLLGFGGFSVLLQVFSIISKHGLSIKKYFIGKLLQGTYAALYTFIAFCIFPMLQFNL